MSLQIVFETEGFSAVRADVRSLSSVEALVPSQAFPQGKCLFTAPARIRLFACMKSLVSLQNLLAFELLAADLAGISMSVCENTLQAPNAIPALFKAAQPTSRMDTLMGSQVFGCRETFYVGTVWFVRT